MNRIEMIREIKNTQAVGLIDLMMREVLSLNIKLSGMTDEQLREYYEA